MSTETNNKLYDRLFGKIVRIEILNPAAMHLGSDDIAISMELDSGDMAYSITTQAHIKELMERHDRSATLVGKFFIVNAKPHVKHLHTYEIFFGDETPFQ